MVSSLKNITIAITEHRREQEMRVLIERYGAKVISCPLLEEVPVEQSAELRGLVRSIIGGELDMMIFFTGVGVRFISDEARMMGDLDAFVAALRGMTVVVRGPKPIKALKSLGLLSDLKPHDPTSHGLLDLLRPDLLSECRVGVQLYGSPNSGFCAELERRGATVKAVQVYNYREASDKERVNSFVQKLINGDVDVLTFTRAPQVRSLFKTVDELGLNKEVAGRLEGKLLVAAIGEVTNEALRQRGFDAAIMPKEPKIGQLAKPIADYFGAYVE